MKKVLIIGAAVFVLGLGGFAAYVATRPAEYQVERSKVIAADAATLLPLLSDLELWSTWNPWDELDPQMTKTYSDPPRGVGAYYTWKGNSEVGVGKMTVTGVTDRAVDYTLEFQEPFQAKSTIHIALDPAPGGTKVTWTMNGNNDFMGKLMGVFMDFDGMIGKDFEKGLDKLDGVATKKS